MDLCEAPATSPDAKRVLIESETAHEPSAVLAPAKLTSNLRIVGVRPDGFHLLEAEMVTISLFDRLEISNGNALRVIDEVEWCGSGGEDVTQPGRPAPNLVERALAAVGRQASVVLAKAIPSGAGLGGGSADAAAVLRWAGCSDLGLAARLGSDVPFCVVGGRALVSGVGESVLPMAFESRHFVLVVPRLHVSTPAVYAAWDALGGPPGPSGNDLEPAALAVAPRLAFWRDLVSGVAGKRPLLAGSGGAWWLEADRGRSEALLLEGDLRGAILEGQKSGRLAAGESALVKAVETVAS